MLNKKEEIFVGGIDLGNKNYKMSMDEELFEFPLAYKEISDFAYQNEEAGRGTKKIKYNDKYYLVGLECNSILPRNKGDKDFREIANMVKLVGLAAFLEKKELQHGKFKLVTGTPLNDFKEYENDYRDLIIDDKVEEITVDGKEYKIQVLDTHITKQCAAVAPTIKDWKEKEHLLLVDLGGGTADIGYFRNGSVVRYMTIDFPLNKIMENLGDYLNGYGLGIERPDETNSGFLNSMENVIKDGYFLNTKMLEVDGKPEKISDIINKWLEVKVNEVVNNIQLRLELTNTIKDAIDVYYFGGGALLLKKELSGNEIFNNKTVLEKPEYANVKAFDVLAKVREW